MLGSIAQDSRGRERYVKVLAGMIKPSGKIHALIENDKGEKYRVTLHPRGASMCRHEVNGKQEPCPGRGRCYHIQAVRMIASLFTEDGIMPREDAPRNMQYFYFDDQPAALVDYNVVNEASQVVVGAELDDMYAKLASTKKVSTVGSLSSNRGFSFWR